MRLAAKHHLALLCSLAGAIACFALLARWGTSQRPGTVNVKVNTAISIIVLSVAVPLAGAADRYWRAAARAAALMVSGFALATLSQDLYNQNFGVDDWLARAAPIDGLLYDWTITNGQLDSATRAPSIRFTPSAVGAMVLSVNVSNVRALSSSSGSRRRLDNRLTPMTVVALERPSEPRLASLEKSPCRADSYET